MRRIRKSHSPNAMRYRALKYLRLSLLPACSILLFLFLLLPGQADVAAAQADSDFMARAVVLAHVLTQRTSIPSSVILAQSILESGWGRKPIATANNYFGMKAFERQDGTINIGAVATGWTWAWTKEWDGKQYVDSQERFRTYRSMADSFDDLGRLYTLNDRYAAAMQQIDNPREFARQIAAAGYATAPDYADRLITLMDGQDLYRYDLPRDGADFMDQSDYPAVRPGEEFEIYFELRNTGFGTWRAEDGYALLNLNAVTMGAPARRDMAGEAGPGDVVRWKVQMTAPSKRGVYRSTWHLIHGETLFGPDMYMDITVAGEPVGPNQRVILMWLAGLSLALVGAIWLAARWQGRPSWPGRRARR